MNEGQKRILFTKAEQDCHDRGIRYIVTTMRDAGFEVIYTNFLYPEEIVNTAIQEDVDAIGLSSSTLGHLPVLREVRTALNEQGREDILIFVGGIIPDDDRAELNSIGINGIFGPGTRIEEVIEFIHRHLER